MYTLLKIVYEDLKKIMYPVSRKRGSWELTGPTEAIQTVDFAYVWI
jgi:hypothetical protein